MDLTAPFIESTVVNPAASQLSISDTCIPDPWFYCSGPGCFGGRSETFTTINQALQKWFERKGSGLIYVESGYSVTEDASVTISGTDPGMRSLRGIVWETPDMGEKPIINGAVTITNLPYGFTIRGIKIQANNNSSALSITNSIGYIKLY